MLGKMNNNYKTNLKYLNLSSDNYEVSAEYQRDQFQEKQSENKLRAELGID